MNLNLMLLRKRLLKLRVALPDPAYRRALRQGVLPAVEHAPVLAQLWPVAVVIDVGANVGQFALVARHAFPGATIVSLEPLPEAGAKLRAVFAGDSKVECIAVAASDTSGTRELHVTSDDDSSSLLPVARRQVDEFPHTAGVGPLQVTTALLDDVLVDRELPAGPLLLKLDTQGTELAALRGAPTLLARAIHVIVEVSFVELYEGQADAADITTFLIERGFGLRSVYDVKMSRLTGEPIQADILFSREKVGTPRR